MDSEDDDNDNYALRLLTKQTLFPLCSLSDAPILGIQDDPIPVVLKRCQRVCASLNNDRKDELFCDACITIGAKKFPVHKAVLTASSSYFRAMFAGSFSEKNEACVEIRGVSESIFNHLLDYIYGEELTLDFENIKEMYVAADMLCVDTLVEECKLYFESNWILARDKFAVYEMAREWEFNEIADMILLATKNHFKAFVMKNYSRDILLDLPSKLRRTPYELISKVLENRAPKNGILRMESTMALTLIMWGLHKPEERFPDQVLQLLSKLHFELILDADYDQMLETCHSNQGVKDDQIGLQTFRDGMKALQEKSHNLISNYNLEIVILDAVDKARMSSLLTFSSSTWKWEIKPCHIGFTPESAILKGNEIYIFGEEGGRIVNTRTQSTMNLPSLPGKYIQPTFGVVDENVYLAGGVHKGSNEHLSEILEFQPNNTSWSCRAELPENKCGAATISVDHRLYIVGKEFSHVYSINEYQGSFTDVCMYDCSSNIFEKICKLPISVYRPKLAVYDDCLYVFQNSELTMQRINLKNKKHTSIENCLIHFPKPYRVLSVCSVSDGVIVALFVEGNILLALIIPYENASIMFLGFVPKPNTDIDMHIMCSDFLYLRKTIPVLVTE